MALAECRARAGGRRQATCRMVAGRSLELRAPDRRRPATRSPLAPTASAVARAAGALRRAASRDRAASPTLPCARLASASRRSTRPRVVASPLALPGLRPRWRAAFDVGAALWAEVQRARRATLLDVDALARAYGWTEAEVLGLSPIRRAAYLQLVGRVMRLPPSPRRHGARSAMPARRARRAAAALCGADAALAIAAPLRWSISRRRPFRRCRADRGRRRPSRWRAARRHPRRPTCVAAAARRRAAPPPAAPAAATSQQPATGRRCATADRLCARTVDRWSNAGRHRRHPAGSANRRRDRAPMPRGAVRRRRCLGSALRSPGSARRSTPEHAAVAPAGRRQPAQQRPPSSRSRIDRIDVRAAGTRRTGAARARPRADSRGLARRLPARASGEGAR